MKIRNFNNFRPDRRFVMSAGGVLIAAGAASCSRGGSAGGDGADPVAATSAGQVRGARAENGTLIFKGIPYGASTTGANRFMPPQPVQPWEGVRDALAYGPTAPQTVPPAEPAADAPDVEVEEPAAAPTGPTSPIRSDFQIPDEDEDCLVLNVWTPNLTGSAPVMFWMHGGGFRSGSGSSQWYESTNIATKQDVVVVTINHRLNVLGYCDLSAYGEKYADSASVGMLDCVQALQWVRDNIASFGGDPDRIMIHGESGGGRKTSVMMALEPAAGLFHRAVVQSGSQLRADTPDVSQEKARRLLEALEIAPADVDQLQNVPMADLQRAQARASAGLGQWRPSVNGVSLPRHPFDPDAPAISANIPMMIGTNRTEQSAFLGTTAAVDNMDEAALRQRMASWLPEDRIDPAIEMYRRIYPEADNAEILYMTGTDRGYFLDSTIQAERKAAQGGAPAFYYGFYWETPVQDGRYHAPHAVEIPFVFDSLANAQYMVGEVTEEKQALADMVSATWANFARNGVPTAPGLPEWPAYNAQERPAMVLDTRPRIENDLRSEQRQFMLDVGSQQFSGESDA
jgi:para-nitrobenzyl esterase